MIDPKLYSLLEVNECRSFVEASRRLSITQPAVSHHIKLLEEELNVRIFHRSGGRILLTPQGETVVKCAKKIVALYGSLKQDLSDRSVHVSHLSVGITHTAESNSIAVALARYCAQNGHLNMKMITNTIDNLYAMLKSYEIDIAVVEGRVPDPDVSYLLLDTDCLILAVSASHPFAKRSMITLSQLKKERMILRLPNSGTRSLFLANLESNNMSIRDFNVVLELDNIDTIKELIRCGFGVSILPKSVCLDELRRKEIVALPVENLSMTREINIAYQNGFTEMHILEDIISAYHDTLQNPRGPQPWMP